ncbi:MAG: agmatinase [Bacteroidetes bacterium]|nr:agmatinase [Bacteroidota bacterium]
MRNFADIDDKYAQFDRASILLQPILYDGTSTWGKGADKGFHAVMEASEHMELYDIETDTEVYRHGIHILPPITEGSSPEHVFQTIYNKTKALLKTQKFLTFFGGEHAVSIGIIKAFYEKYPDLTILQLDAHTDLRKSYDGSPLNHACALHDANKHTNLVQVGIRSMDQSEIQYLKKENCFFAWETIDNDGWIGKSIDLMTENVYITIDLDVFDPSIMPSTGTPEPGGLGWYTVLHYLRKVFQQKNIVGFDIVELAPVTGNPAPDFLTAKLYYSLLSYKFKYSETSVR